MPSITIDLGTAGAVGLSTYLDQGFATTNRSSSSVIRVGDEGAGSDDCIGLIQFDMYASGLPRNVLVTAASLQLYAEAFGAGSSGATISCGLAGHGSAVVLNQATWTIYATDLNWSSRADMLSSPSPVSIALPEAPAGSVTYTGMEGLVNHARRYQGGVITFALDDNGENANTDYVDFTDDTHISNAPKLILTYSRVPSFPVIP